MEATAMNAYTVVTRKGQITIPSAIRKSLGIEVGDRIEVTLTGESDRFATIRRVPSVAESTYGLARWQGPPIDVAEFGRIVEDEIVDEAARELGLVSRSK
jgi:AbrB family looped-hinge helix DNA binding protein